jgi:HPt (histidine-containing phosphotransfer) domain-containing protein
MEPQVATRTSSRSPRASVALLQLRRLTEDDPWPWPLRSCPRTPCARFCGDTALLGQALEELVREEKRAIRRLSKGETAIDQAWPEPPPDLVPNVLEPLLRSQYVAEVVDRLAQIDDALGSSVDPLDAASAVYRHVHTMKGAASAVGDEPMAWFCHGLEERLRNGASSRETATGAPNEVAKYRAVLGGLLEVPEAALATLRGLPARSRPPNRPSARPSHWPDDEARPAEGDATIRVSSQDVSGNELGESRAAQDPIPPG